jgi:hypothetical protein
MKPGVARALFRHGVTRIQVVSGTPICAILPACAGPHPHETHPSEPDADLPPALLHDGPTCVDVPTHEQTPPAPGV